MRMERLLNEILPRSVRLMQVAKFADHTAIVRKGDFKVRVSIFTHQPSVAIGVGGRNPPPIDL
jgi:ribosomal protein S3